MLAAPEDERRYTSTVNTTTNHNVCKALFMDFYGLATFYAGRSQGFGVQPLTRSLLKSNQICRKVPGVDY